MTRKDIKNVKTDGKDSIINELIKYAGQKKTDKARI